MHSKLLFIFLLNISFSQALLNRAIGGEELFGSAKSFSMGFTHSINANNSSIVRYNPSLLSYNSKGSSIVFDIQINNKLLKERRSILVKDYFGDFLTYADYLNNNNIYHSFQGGFQTNINNTYGFGISLLPLASFNYDYIEEIRGDAPSQDGEVVFRDPLVGYHIFNTEGILQSLSIGTSFSYSNSLNNFNVGLGYHYILDTEVKNDLHVDSLTTQIQNISLVDDYKSSQKFNNVGDYFSIGLTSITNDLLLSFVFESDFLIQTNNQPINFIDSLGTISYINDFIDLNANEELGYGVDSTIFESLNHYKPQKIIFGINYNPKNNKDLTVSLEIETNKVMNNDNTYLKDYDVFKLGFEYLLPNSTPIRAGIVYKTSPIILIPEQAIFTFGTGGSFKNIIYDLGMSYSTFDYFYSDLFSVEGDQLTGFDKINESNLSTIFTIGYKF